MVTYYLRIACFLSLNMSLFLWASSSFGQNWPVPEPYSWQEEVFAVPDNCVEFRNREQPGVSDTTHNLQLDDIGVEIFVDRRSNAPDYMAAFDWPSGWIATPVDLLVEENETGTVCFKKWIGV